MKSRCRFGVSQIPSLITLLAFMGCMPPTIPNGHEVTSHENVLHILYVSNLPQDGSFEIRLQITNAVTGEEGQLGSSQTVSETSAEWSFTYSGEMIVGNSYKYLVYIDSNDNSELDEGEYHWESPDLIAFTGAPVEIEVDTWTQADLDDSPHGTTDHTLLLTGTWIKDGSVTKLKIEISTSRVLFKQPWVGDDGTYVTYGNFGFLSYDGTTVTISDYNDDPVTFAAVLSENVLTVDELDHIAWTDPPFDPRKYLLWSGTYVRDE